MNNPVENFINELTRDLTTVHPKPKSLVRRKLQELVAMAKGEEIERCVEIIQSTSIPARQGTGAAIEEIVQKIRKSLHEHEL